MSFKERIKHIYEHKYKTLMIFPILLLVLALVQIGYQTYTTGDFLNRGVSLKGGSTITLNEINIDVQALENVLKQQFPTGEISVRTLYVSGQASGVAVDSSIQDSGEINKLTKAIELQTKIP